MHKEGTVLFRKKVYEHEKLGMLKFENGVWVGQDANFTYYLEGGKTGPSQPAMNQSLSLDNIQELVEISLNFLLDSDIENISAQLKYSQAESIWFHGEEGRIAISFGHSSESWEYIVYLQNLKPTDISVVH